MPIDYTKLRQKLSPQTQVGGDPGLQIRVGTVAAINSSTGLVTLTLDGVAVPGVASLGGAAFAVGTVVQVLSYRGALLILGGSNSVTAQPVEATGVSSSGTTTATGFTNTLTAGGGGAPTGGIHGVAFFAPPSGKVSIISRAVVGSNTAGQYTIIDFEVKTGSTVGSGSTVRSPSENTAGVHQSATANSQGTVTSTALVTGLTPGAVYNVAMTYHATGTATSSINRRYVSAVPH